MGSNVTFWLIKFYCYNSLVWYAFELIVSFHSNFRMRFFEGGVYVMPHLNVIMRILLMFTLLENIEKCW